MKSFRLLRLVFFLLLFLIVFCAALFALRRGYAQTVLPPGSDIRAAILAAPCGSTIILQAGATYPLFSLPNKPCTTYTTITGSRASELPEGVRVKPSDSVKMAKIETSQTENRGAISTDPGAHHYKLIGLEAAQHPASQTLTIVVLDSGNQGPGNTVNVPHHIVLDRMYIHSLPANMFAVRGIALNSSDTEVRNSYISEIHGQTTDSHAIFAWNGPGNLVIDNNYLEASSICLQTGYGESQLTPDNVLITRNTLSRPLAWRGVYPNVKNNFEMKGGTNVRVIGNLMENNWSDGQSGHSVVLSAYENDISNVTITSNIIRNVGAGFTVFGSPSRGGVTDKVTVSNNLVSITPGMGAGFFANIGTSADVIFDHNTSLMGDVRNDGNNFAVAQGLQFKNSIIGFPGVQGWAVIKTLPLLAKTLVVGVGAHSGTKDIFGYQDYASVAPAPAWPQSTLYPDISGSILWFVENVSQAGFAGDFRLASTSVYKGKGTDGKDLGVDIDQLTAAMGEPQPTPTPTPVPTPTPSPTPVPREAAWFTWPSSTSARKAFWLQKGAEGWTCFPYDSVLYCWR